jgi:hypothetical protein
MNDTASVSRTLEENPLLTLEEIAQHLVVSDQTIRRYRKGKGCGELGPFPEPDAWAGTHPRWFQSTVDTWSRSSHGKYCIIVHDRLSDGPEEAVRNCKRIADEVAGPDCRVRMLNRTDGSCPIEVVWPCTSGVEPKLLALCLTLGDAPRNFFERAFVKALRSRPALMEQLARANAPGR